VASGPLFLLRLQKHPQGTGIDGGIRAEYIEVLVTRKPPEKQSDNIL
jgi:hypothetical protein